MQDKSFQMTISCGTAQTAKSLPEIVQRRNKWVSIHNFLF